MARICPTCPSVLSSANAKCPVHDTSVDGDDPFVGRSLGEYRIASRLRAERGGVWYRAVDDRSNRFDALIGYGEINRDDLARATQEAGRAAQLSEARVARIVATGSTTGGPPYLIYETTSGPNLANLVEHGGAFDLSRAVKTMRAVCEALAAADAWELSHLGLTPKLITLDGENAIITGFGAAALRRLAGAPVDSEWLGPVATTEPSFTDDVYALGALFHALLFGTPPGDVPNELPRDPTLGRLLARMVAKDRSARPTSVDELLEELVERPRPRLASDLTMPPEKGVNTYILEAGAVPRERVAVAAAGLDIAKAPQARQDTAPMPSGTFNDKGAAGVAPLPPDKKALPDRAKTRILPNREPAANERRIETLVVRPRGLPSSPRPAIEQRPLEPEPERPTTPMASAAPIVLDDDDIEPLDPPRSRTGAFLLVAFAACAALLGVWLALDSEEAPPIEVAASAVEAPTKVVEAPPPIEPVGSAETELLPEGDALPDGDAPVEARKVAQVVLRIDSEPQGAVVYLTNGSAVLGETPFEIRRDASDERMGFELRLDGYKPSLATMSANEDGRIEVVMEKLAARPPPPKAEPPPTRPAPPPERVSTTRPPPKKIRRRVRRRRTRAKENRKTLERGTLLDPFSE